MPYRNPVIPGFYPDPSVCRVGEDFYLVTSTFEYFPGVPIFHSRDLVNWHQIGHCLTRESQLPLHRARSSGGIYAPTIRYHAGTFYMVTTNVTGGGHFYVTTTDPAGEWSEPIWVDHPGIDPSLFFGDRENGDGAVYFTCNGPGDYPTAIYQFEIDIATGNALTESKRIWDGTGGMFPEAPHLYKSDGVYYLMLAEGGTGHGHMVTIARSDNPWGPWEPCPHNPILSHRSRFTSIQATGHADLFEDHQGHWWMVCLGIRPRPDAFPPSHHLGRETFLTPVTWQDGWPIVGEKGAEEGMIAQEMDVQTLPLQRSVEAPPRDDFDATTLDLSWNFLRNPMPDCWSLSARPGWLTLIGNEMGLDDVDTMAWIGRRQQHFACTTRALFDFDPQHEHEEAGLTARMNEQHYCAIYVANRDGKRHINARLRIGPITSVIAHEPLDEGPVELGIEADQEAYRLFYRQADGTEVNLAYGNPHYLSTEVAGGFTGVYLGVYASGNGQRCETPAHFDWFEYVAGS